MPLYVLDRELSPEDLTVSNILSVNSLQQKSKEFTSIPCRKLAECDKVLYIMQKEYATIKRNKRNPTVKFIGSEDATTCHVVVMITKSAVSMGHFDCTKISNVTGLSFMVQQVKNGHSFPQTAGCPADEIIDVHIVGGFADEHGTSDKVLATILFELCNCLPHASFNIKTACVSTQNNRVIDGKNVPIIYGIGVDIDSGDIFPARFSYKGPSEVLRHARFLGNDKKMQNVYNTVDDTFVIQPFVYDAAPEWLQVVLGCTDEQILQFLSTSPHCEPDDFVFTMRKTLQFLLEHSDPRTVFKNWQPLVYKMGENGLWMESSVC
eukprot:gene20035-22000_t